MSAEDTLRAVSVLDSALDIRAMGDEDLHAYLRTRDPALVKERPGEKLTWFTIRRLPISIYQRYVMAGASDQERQLRAFATSVTRIENFRWSKDGPYESRTGSGEMRSVGGPITIWTEAELEHLPPSYVLEIGAIAELRSFLPQGSEVLYPLPLLSARGLAARMPRLADEIRSSAVGPTSEAPPASSPPTPPDGASAAPIAATATGQAIASPAGS